MIDLEEKSWNRKRKHIGNKARISPEVSNERNRDDRVHEDPRPPAELTWIESVSGKPEDSQLEVFDRVTEVAEVQRAQHRDECLSKNEERDDTSFFGHKKWRE